MLELALSVSISFPFLLRPALSVHGNAIAAGLQEPLDRRGEPFDLHKALLGHVAPTLVLLELRRGDLARVLAIAGIGAGGRGTFTWAPGRDGSTWDARCEPSAMVAARGRHVELEVDLTPPTSSPPRRPPG
jgi:hypothetical protein